MGWLRLVGSSKLYVSFAKELYKRDNVLQKRPGAPVARRTAPKLPRVVRAPQIYRSLLQKSFIKETIFCKRDQARGGEVHRAEAAARRQGRSKFWGEI